MLGCDRSGMYVRAFLPVVSDVFLQRLPPRFSSENRPGVASPRRDVLVFSAAATALALHATVDSFLAPEPGTGAS